MDLIVDANILFAALIKQGKTDELLFVDHLRLFAPEFILIEFEKYKKEILKKTKRTPEDFNRLLEVLRRRINLVPLDEIVPFLEQAEKISPDPKDIAYIALALKLHIAIWSNDKALKEKQDRVKVYTTPEVMKL